MKKTLILSVIVIALLVSACATQTSSPEQIATFCLTLDKFYNAMVDIAAAEADASEAELKIAIEKANSAYADLQVAAKGMDEPEVQAFMEAADKLNTAIMYAGDTAPSMANYMQMVVSVQLQIDALKVAYQVVSTTTCNK